MEAQETKNDAVIPVIIPDLDKVRHMPIDRKDVVDALAMDYEDELITKKKDLEKKLNEDIEKINLYRITGSAFNKDDDKINPAEVNDYFSAIKKSLKQYLHDNDSVFVRLCREGKHKIISDVSRSAVMIARLENAYNDGSLMNPELIASQSYSGSYEFLVSVHLNPKVKWYDKAMDFLKIEIESKSDEKTNILARLKKDKIIPVSSDVHIFIPVPKEADTISSIRETIAKRIIASYIEYRDIEKQMKNLPDVIRRMKARLTKKAISDTAGGQRVLEYFMNELTESKRITEELPMLSKGSSRKRK